MVASCGPDYLKKYDAPLTYKQAIKKKDIDFPLPSSAHHVNYAMYADWQTYEKFVRFEAPVEDCIKHVDVVIDWDNKVYKRTSTYDRRHVTSVGFHGGDATMGPTPWFDVDRITNGLYTGKEDMLTPQIWIDLDKGVFYFFEYH